MEKLQNEEMEIGLAPVSKSSTEAKGENATSNTPPESDGTGPTTAAKEEQIDLSDPTLPLNWSLPKKYFNLIVPALLTFVVYAFNTPAITRSY